MQSTVGRLLRVACVVLGAAVVCAQGGVQYIYDDLGRLVGVIEANGDSATYLYDAVGNLLAIERHGGSVVSIVAFSPASGPVGATVTIAGTAFSATPGQNTVTFNGTAAAVTTATVNELVVTVPSGATTGTIAVTAPGGSTTSATAFVVTTASAAPTITGFSPAAGVGGTSVTITGTNFDPDLANDKTHFNRGLTAPATVTATTLTAPVPASTGSGRISVTTPFGTAVSDGDFIIPPPPHVVTDVAASGRLPFGVATVVTIPTAGDIGLMLFDASAGQRVSVLGTNGMSGHYFGCDVSVTILDPSTEALGAPVCMESTGFIGATTLPVAGTYTILVEPVSSVSGSLTLTPYDIPPDVSGSVAPGGAPVTVTMTTPGQNGALTFVGTTGQRISLLGTDGMSGQVGLTCDVNVSILDPDSSVLAANTCMEQSGFIDLQTLPATGTYTIAIDPASWATGSLTLTLYDVPPDLSGSISPGGSAVTTTITTPGQNATLTFVGTTGQRISLLGTNGLSGQVFGCDVNVSIVNPDSTVLAANTCMEQSGFIGVHALPATGTYTILINPASWATGNLTLTLYNVPPDVGGSITPGGSSVTTTMTTPGQNGALTFAGTTGQRIALLGTDGMSGQLFGCDVNVRILNPDRTVLAPDTCMEQTGFIDTHTLPATGTYTIAINPSGVATGDLTLTLYNVPAEVAGSLTPDGPSVTTTITTPGQNGALTFAGTTSQRISLLGTNGMTGQIAFICDVNVRILNPDSSVLAPNTCMEGSGFIDTRTLPATGTYTIAINPTTWATGGLTVTLYDVAPDVGGTLTIDGGAQPITISSPGQKALLTFSGTSGQQVTVHVTSNTIGSTVVTLLKPDGSTLTSTSSSASSFNLSTQTLPVTGTYTVRIDPSGSRTGDISVSVTNP